MESGLCRRIRTAVQIWNDPLIGLIQVLSLFRRLQVLNNRHLVAELMERDPNRHTQTSIFLDDLILSRVAFSAVTNDLALSAVVHVHVGGHFGFSEECSWPLAPPYWGSQSCLGAIECDVGQ